MTKEKRRLLTNALRFAENAALNTVKCKNALRKAGYDIEKLGDAHSVLHDFQDDIREALRS